MAGTKTEHSWRSGPILNMCRVVNKTALTGRYLGERFRPYQRWVPLIYGVVRIPGPAEKSARGVFCFTRLPLGVIQSLPIALQAQPAWRRWACLEIERNDSKSAAETS